MDQNNPSSAQEQEVKDPALESSSDVTTTSINDESCQPQAEVHRDSHAMEPDSQADSEEQAQSESREGTDTGLSERPSEVFEVETAEAEDPPHGENGEKVEVLANTEADMPGQEVVIPEDQYEVLPQVTPTTAADMEKLIIVGVGSSAGGLEALRQFLTHLPEHPNIAFVTAQHLSPDRPSMLVSLLSRDTSLHIAEVRDGQPAQPNTMYITPPNKDVVVKDGILYLRTPATGIVPKPSVDTFFTSLAEDRKEKAIGIILSGTGSDGAHGVRAIKAHGGIVLVQDETSAQYNGMPRAAINTGCVDMILPPENMGTELLSILKFPYGLAPIKSPETDHGLEKILRILFERTGVDFSDYKPNTIHRRLERRMVANKFETMEAYSEFLEHSKTEADTLCKGILISVTSFFRDQEAFNNLESIIAELVSKKQKSDSIRVWVPGCASGEEVYSIAILLAEHLGNLVHRITVQIFGTDIDMDALEIARKGAYPEVAVGGIDQERLNRYFVRSGNSLQVVKSLREMVIFSRHDLVKDPPFLRIDIISCRNLLIYFKPDLQKRILALFHYSLIPNCYLFLGKSETIGQFSELFTTLDKTNRIFKSRGGVKQTPLDIANRMPSQITKKTQPQRRQMDLFSVEDAMFRTLVDALKLNCVVINENYNILHVYGDVNPYLSFPPGEFEPNLLRMAGAHLNITLRAVIQKCIRDKTAQTSNTVRVNHRNKEHAFRVKVEPMVWNKELTGHLLILFEEAREQTSDIPLSADAEGSLTHERLMELERELNVNRENLQTVVEELETSNEELQSLNEELQSSNEELQSTNEELESANEELQSTNEELLTVNEELQIKSTELAVANTDLENIQNSIGFAMLVVDKELKVTRFNFAATKIFELAAGDIGHVLTTVPCRINLPNIREEVMGVITAAKMMEKEIQGNAQTFWLRIFPYYSESYFIEGVVLTFQDITQRKQLEETLRESHTFLQSTLDALLPHLAILDENGVIIAVNTSWRKFGEFNDFKGSGFDVGTNYLEVVEKTDDEHSRMIVQGIRDVMAKKRFEFKLEYPGYAKDEKRWFHLKVSRFDYRGSARLVVMHENITQRKLQEEEIRQRTQELSVANTRLQQEIKERERAEVELQHNNDLFKQITENIKEVLFVKDLESDQIIFVTQSYEEIWGRSREALYENPLDLISIALPQDQALIQKHLSLQDHLEHSAINYRIVREDGVERWIHSRVFPVVGINQKVNRMIGIMEDVTEQKQYEHDLQENEARLRAVFETAADGIITVDQNGRIESINPALGKIFGYKTSELLGHNVRMLFSPQHEDYFNSLFHQDRHGLPPKEAKLRQELTGVRKTGVSFPLELAVSEVQFGNTRLYTGIVHDITERKQAQEQQAYFASIVESTDDAILAKNLDETINSWNRAAERLYGYTTEEAVGKSIRILIPEELEPELEELMAQIRQGRSVDHFQTIRRHKDGHLLDVSLTVSPIISNEGKIIGASAIARNITQQKLAEKELAEAKEEAISANRAKSEFLANMSHEIRTPLTSIIGFSQILLKKSQSVSVPKEFRQYLENIKLSGQNLSELINNILDLSKIEAGKLSLTEEVLNLRQLIQGVYHINKAQAIEKQIKFSYDIDPNLPTWVHSDRTKLNQILMNLVNNAIKFTPESRKVHIHAMREEDRVAIFVIDEGIGISSERQHDIFKAFEQADSTTTKRFGGTGLGLAITQQLTMLMGGDLSLQSEPEKGATFVVRLPLVEVTEQKVEDQSKELNGIQFEPGNIVLLVEDNQVNQEMITILFRDLGIEVFLAENGEDGVRKARELKPDLILMDIHMPGMDGLEASRQIRNLEDCAHIPIVAITANAFTEHQQAAFELGLNDYLTKPVDFNKLLPVLSKYLKVVAKGQQPPAPKQQPLPKMVEDKIREELKGLTKTPIYYGELLIDQIHRIRGLCRNYQTNYPQLLDVLERFVEAGDEEGLKQQIDQAFK